MRVAVTGSIATDHLMTFPGRFTDQLVQDKLESISLSFLVDQLDIRRGGVAANIAFGMGSLGLTPILVGSVGNDFADYRSWLDRHGVDTSSVRTSDVAYTARFVCTTDADDNQLASFYPGAMSEAREIELQPIAERFGGLDVVLVSPNDPEAMIRHSEECRTRGYAFAADPSQQLAIMEGDAIRKLIDGATYLFTNEYESALTEQKTGWSPEEILDRVKVRVTTHGAKGVVIERKGEPAISVPVVPVTEKRDPTGVGDGFRAGFLAGLSWDLPYERCAQIGSLIATYVLETVGPQEYTLDRTAVLARLTETYGEEAAAEIGAHLS